VVMAGRIHQWLVRVGEGVFGGEHHRVHFVQGAGWPAWRLSLLEAWGMPGNGSLGAAGIRSVSGEGHVHGYDVVEVGEALSCQAAVLKPNRVKRRGSLRGRPRFAPKQADGTDHLLRPALRDSVL
jgi:hypothetical protein